MLHLSLDQILLINLNIATEIVANLRRVERGHLARNAGGTPALQRHTPSSSRETSVAMYSSIAAQAIKKCSAR